MNSGGLQICPDTFHVWVSNAVLDVGRLYCILATNSSANAQLNMYNGHDYKAMEPPRTTKGLKTQAWRHEQIQWHWHHLSHDMQQLACFPICLLSVLLKICCKHKSGEGRHIQQIYVHQTTENGGLNRRPLLWSLPLWVVEMVSGAICNISPYSLELSTLNFVDIIWSCCNLSLPVNSIGSAISTLR